MAVGKSTSISFDNADFKSMVSELSLRLERVDGLLTGADFGL